MKKSMKFVKQKIFQRNNKGQKGITLIALVITIIVLLILAGVTMTMLSGNNSAPEKATEAAQKDAIAGAKDEIAMTVQERLLNYYNNTYVKGNVTEGASTRGEVAEAAYDAVENAKKRNSQLLPSSTVDKENYTITLNTKSYTVTGTIDENGGITWSDTVASTGGGTGGGTLTNAEKKEKINDAIGQNVNYSGYSSSYSRGWRVFYASEKEMFLISTGVISFNDNNGIPITDYTNSDDVFDPKNPEKGSIYTYKDVTYGADYNSKWQKKLVEANKTDNEDRSKATAYLCDPKNWEKYISTNAPTGTYAVGGPTMELLALSWEATGNQAKWSDNIDDDVETNGYVWDKPEGLYKESPLKPSILEGLYNIGVIYWLASPSNKYTGGVGVVNGNGSVGGNHYSYIRGVRPIVSIPISNVQIEEDGTVKIE